MKKRLLKFFHFCKVCLSYIVCCMVPKSLEEPINTCSTVEELDDMIIEKAGL